MMTNSMCRENDAPLLRRALRGNAVFSSLSGLTFILIPSRLAQVTGIQSPVAFVLTGMGLLSYALWLWFGTREETVPRRVAVTAIAGDTVWVVGSILLLVGGWLPLTTAGQWAVAIVADIVAVFALLQLYGLRRSR